jgi:hypothetical protein
LDEIFRVYTFWGSENESVVRFLKKKIVLARENSAKFDFLTKTAYFKQLKKKIKLQYMSSAHINLFVQTYILRFHCKKRWFFKILEKEGGSNFVFFQNLIFLNDENRAFK